MADTKGSLTGLSNAEAQEFHKLFMQGFIGWVAICFFAHVLVWFWRPWFPGAASMQTAEAWIIDNATQMSQYMLQFSA